MAGGIIFEVEHIYWEHAWSDAWHYAYVHRVVILKIWWSWMYQEMVSQSVVNMTFK
jgi:hypothetical protein